MVLSPKSRLPRANPAISQRVVSEVAAPAENDCNSTAVALFSIVTFSNCGVINGSVVVEFIISTDGDVIDTRVVKSSHREFEMPALQAVQKWKFKPGRRRGQVVNVRASQLLEFNATE